MTCTNTAAPSGTETDEGATTCTKAILFCPECGFRAPWDGPWCVRTATGYRSVRCPDCGTRVA